MIKNIVLDMGNVCCKWDVSYIASQLASSLEEKDYIIFEFENNGPKLDKKYTSTPDIIFTAGETTKENGTGLGLWICKDAVQRNNGEIHVVPCDLGFKIKIKWPS